MSSPVYNNIEDSIPLADDEPEAPSQPLVDLESPSITSDPNNIDSLTRIFDTLPSTFTNDCMTIAGQEGLDPDISPDEHEEKARLITQVLELQNTLDDLSQRVDSVKEENLKLRSENQVLGQYIESLMSASSVFQPTSPKNKKK